MTTETLKCTHIIYYNNNSNNNNIILCIINLYNSGNDVKPSLEVEMHMTINFKYYLGIAFEQ